MKIHTTGAAARRAFTITELLVAAAISVIVVGAVVFVFRDIGKKITVGRSRLELAGQLRTVNGLLRDDLDRVTVPAQPWPQISGAEGYLEICESYVMVAGTPGSDLHTFPDTSLGDCNDYLAMTVHNPDQPYQGRIQGGYLVANGDGRTFRLVVDPTRSQTIESHTAEVIWFLSFTDNDGDGVWDGGSAGEPLKLMRRQFLVRPDIDMSAGTVAFAHQNYDVSVHVNALGALQSNTLADLSDRGKRVARDSRITTNVAGVPTFPYVPVSIAALSFPAGSLRRGEDLVISDVVAFDLRVYDPGVNVNANGANGLLPEDIAYSTAGEVGVARGAFVDIGVTGNGFFGVAPQAKSGLGAVYDTWTTLYENDGIDQDGGTTGIDQGTNGIDDNGAFGVDDPTERETAPPYPHRLRGLNARVRVVEFSRNQVMQTSVSHSFVPE